MDTNLKEVWKAAREIYGECEWYECRIGARLVTVLWIPGEPLGRAGVVDGSRVVWVDAETPEDALHSVVGATGKMVLA